MPIEHEEELRDLRKRANPVAALIPPESDSPTCGVGNLQRIVLREHRTHGRDPRLRTVVDALAKLVAAIDDYLKPSPEG
jgi:hypothetical protein